MWATSQRMDGVHEGEAGGGCGLGGRQQEGYVSGIRTKIQAGGQKPEGVLSRGAAYAMGGKPPPFYKG